MNILFINYWGLNEGLTQATTLPNLKILNEDNRVRKIIFTTIEREDKNVTLLSMFDKVKHIPLYSGMSVFNKFADFTIFPKGLIEICKEYKIDEIIARGAPTGGIAWLVSRKTKIPFVVESYEPHADYMLSGGTWRKSGFKYQIQKLLERKQNKYASGLITVTHNYKRDLIRKGIGPSKVMVAPCPVDLKRFYPDTEERTRVRKYLNCTPDSVLGIYVGKFGDIYYKEEIIPIFKEAFKIFDDFRLVILTPQKDEFIDVLKSEFGEKLHLLSVPHTEVNSYLSASDFAFATIREHPVRAYCSPIKTGEYWACGLPVFITVGVGDDSHIIEETQLGATFTLSKPQTITDGLSHIKKLIKKKGVQEDIQNLALKYRSIDYTKRAYEKLLF
jgi:glycosyltransferase involved in cell wall biosynthesis